MSVILTNDEAQALLDEVGDSTIRFLKNKPQLFSAIMKLANVLPPASVAPERSYKWYMNGDKIQLIKAVRIIACYGLKNAKDFVDERIVQSCQISFLPQELGLANNFSTCNVAHEKLAGQGNLAFWSEPL